MIKNYCVLLDIFVAFKGKRCHSRVIFLFSICRELSNYCLPRSICALTVFDIALEVLILLGHLYNSHNS